ncbi:MAG: hypothetical protein WDN28_21685 [Chthoniobacter sp.]
MTAVATAPTSTTAPASTDDTTFPAVERAAIDASARGPVLFFFGNGLLWLMLSTVLGLIASIELYAPSFLADVPFLSYGRIWPAFTNAISFGWGSLAGLGGHHLAAGPSRPGPGEIPRRARHGRRLLAGRPHLRHHWHPRRGRRPVWRAWKSPRVPRC